ncbi:non-specific lipid transfer protein GPI-anchored 15-like [Salvia miltiorrhiza]|uniref:non-specific lipid transfer protein GPI-anchored 15-like n=1 Tax=Salvia miltiorrhiza TaxID=226208 RepID=UPI0025AD76AD|nr:non-specific lipid transfer protein GPI-anchored 15-like [Salvia miltiorrhiza]
MKMRKSGLLAILAVAMVWGSGRGQTGCTKTLMALSPCLNYVSGNTSTPAASCCSQLSNVVSSQPQCLCLLLNGTASSYGLDINQTLALQLPDACAVQTPPTSRCNGETNAPSASPDTQGSPPADAQPAAIPSAGSKTVPSVSGATNVRATYDIAALLLFLASSALSLPAF